MKTKEPLNQTEISNESNLHTGRGTLKSNAVRI